jgi:MFS family permease
MTFDGRKATTLFMLILFVGACVIALGLPAKAAFMPLLVCIPGSLLCAAQLVLDFRCDDAEGRGKDREADDDTGKSETEMFVWLLLFTAALLGFGFIVGGPLIVTLFIRMSSRETWQRAIFAGAGTFAVLYGVFVWLLELSLFNGFVIDWLVP